MAFEYIFILGNAFILGLRHGLDWDHIAAITDIVGTAGATRVNGSGVAALSENAGIKLSSCYAMGHATIVLVLGILALNFATILPQWIDPLMERAVGATLILLGLWILYSSLNQPADSKGRLQSRWMFLISKIQKESDRSPSPLQLSADDLVRKPLPYDSPAAFAIGLIHGFGAETGTQVLLIAAVGCSSNHQSGLLLLLSFIFGLLLSNTLVAVLAGLGFSSTAKFKSFFLATSALTAIFSLMIGVVFITGNSDLLPDLQHWVK